MKKLFLAGCAIALSVIGIATELKSREPVFVSPLAQVIERGDLATLKKMINEGADISERLSPSGYTPLQAAIRVQNPPMVQLLLENGANIAKISSSGKSTLEIAQALLERADGFIAQKVAQTIFDSIINREFKIFVLCAEGDVDAVEHMLTKGENIDLVWQGGDRGTIKPGDTLLHVAARTGNLPMAQMLVKKGASKDIKNVNGGTPLKVAERAGKKNIIEFLGGNVQEAPKPQVIPPLKRPVTPETSQMTPQDLFEAVWVGDWNSIQTIKKVLSKDPDAIKVVWQGGSKGLMRPGDSLLHVAIRGGNFEMAEVLVNKGADKDAKNYSGETPWSIAQKANNSHIFRLLTGENREWAMNLFLACLEDNVKSIEKVFSQYSPSVLDEYLVWNGRDLGSIRPGDNLLHVAARAGNLAIVKWLVAKGVNKTMKNKNGGTPLDAASKANRRDIVDFLSGKNTQSQEEKNVAALFAAIEQGDTEAVAKLIRAGVDVNTRSQAGYTPLQIAVLYQNLPMVELLVGQGADANIKAFDGNTAFTLAERAVAETNDKKIAQEIKDVLFGLKKAEKAPKKVSSEIVPYQKPQPISVEQGVLEALGAKDSSPEQILGIKADYYVVPNSNNVRFKYYSLSGAKNAYKRLSLKWHPDKNKNPLASEVFKAMGTALEDVKKTNESVAYTATTAGDLELFKKAFDAGIEMDADYSGFQYTPLYLAIYVGMLPIVEFLLSKGALAQDKDLELAFKARYNRELDKEQRAIATAIHEALMKAEKAQEQK